MQPTEWQVGIIHRLLPPTVGRLDSQCERRFMIYTLCFGAAVSDAAFSNSAFRWRRQKASQRAGLCEVRTHAVHDVNDIEILVFERQNFVSKFCRTKKNYQKVYCFHFLSIALIYLSPATRIPHLFENVSRVQSLSEEIRTVNVRPDWKRPWNGHRPNVFCVAIIGTMFFRWPRCSFRKSKNFAMCLRIRSLWLPEKVWLNNRHR